MDGYTYSVDRILRGDIFEERKMQECWEIRGIEERGAELQPPRHAWPLCDDQRLMEVRRSGDSGCRRS